MTCHTEVVILFLADASGWCADHFRNFEFLSILVRWLKAVLEGQQFFV